MAGLLESIWIKRFRRGPMDPAREARLVAGRGIVGNANQGGRRQVTIISREAWKAATDELALDLDPSTRRANLMVSGVELEKTRGRVLRVGQCRLRVYGETTPCSLMEDAQPGLRTALKPKWRGGVFAEVLDDGTITVGDPVEWVEAGA